MWCSPCQFAGAHEPCTTGWVWTDVLWRDQPVMQSGMTQTKWSPGFPGWFSLHFRFIFGWNWRCQRHGDPPAITVIWTQTNTAPLKFSSATKTRDRINGPIPWPDWSHWRWRKTGTCTRSSQYSRIRKTPATPVTSVGKDNTSPHPRLIRRRRG